MCLLGWLASACAPAGGAPHPAHLPAARVEALPPTHDGGAQAAAFLTAHEVTFGRVVGAAGRPCVALSADGTRLSGTVAVAGDSVRLSWVYEIDQSGLVFTRASAVVFGDDSEGRGRSRACRAELAVRGSRGGRLALSGGAHLHATLAGCLTDPVAIDLGDCALNGS